LRVLSTFERNIYDNIFNVYYHIFFDLQGAQELSCSTRSYLFITIMKLGICHVMKQCSKLNNKSIDTFGLSNVSR